MSIDPHKIILKDIYNVEHKPVQFSSQTVKSEGLPYLEIAKDRSKTTILERQRQFK